MKQHEDGKPRERRVETEQEYQATLFVRNIGWDTSQNEFKAYMEKFGDVKYAVLCRAQGDDEKADGEE